MEPFWIIVCIICVPLLFLGAPYIAMFLTLIPIQIIGFIEKIVVFFKDEPTSQTLTLPEKKESPSEQSHKPISSPPKSEAPKQYVRTYPPPRPVQPPQPPKEPVDYLQKSRNIKCDSMGNIKTYSPVKKNNSENKSAVIVAIVIACVAFLAILFGIILSVMREQNPSSTAVHTHEYVKGQCVSCLEFDETYCDPIYQDILFTMRSMSLPIRDLNAIKNNLDKLPDDYLQVKKILAQQSYLYSQCSAIRNQSIQSNPDYQLIQTSYFNLLDKKEQSSYSMWNMSGIIQSFHNEDLYLNPKTFWGILYGYWESPSGYFFECDGEYLDTNIPTPLDYVTSNYYFTAYNFDVSVCETADSQSLKAFRITKIDAQEFLLYSYETGLSYRFIRTENPVNSAGNSSSVVNYIGNRETKKFHYSWCSYLPDWENCTTLCGRASAISKGYSPCKHCNP